jgi:hypothetical protein
MTLLSDSVLLILSVGSFFIALLICALHTSVYRGARRTVGLIAVCEAIYFTAFFAALLRYSQTGSFALWGAIAAYGIISAIRRIAPSLILPFPFLGWLLGSACYASFLMFAFLLGLPGGASFLVLLWPLGIACAIAMTTESHGRV